MSGPRYAHHRALVGRTPSVFLVLLLVAACREQVVQPVPSDSTTIDSTAIIAPPPPRPPGLALAPATSDSMVLAMDTDSFTVRLTDRECAAPNNWVVVTSPVLDTLSSTMCQEPIDMVWSFTDGPYPAGTAVLLDFESGVSGWDGKVRFSQTLPAAFPQWNLEFEDAGDNDWNDFLLRVQAYTDTAISLVADTTELHPWVPRISPINGFTQARRLGDSTALSISATGAVDVTIRAEFLDKSGGHSHIDPRVSFDDIAAAVDRGTFIQLGSILGQPLAGFFAMGGDSAASFVDVPTEGAPISLTFTAGTVGGLVDIIAETVVESTLYADTVTLSIKVPDLIHADTSDVVNSVYFVGGVPNPVQGGPDVHVQASNWYMPQDVAESVEAIASNYRIAHALVVGGGLKYLQHNDASLKFGGTFSVTGLTGDLGDHPTNHQHWSHQLGLDVDFNWCMVAQSGDDNQANRVYGTTCPDSTDYVDFPILRDLANAREACARVHNGNHFHIRFTGRCPDA